jgi:hypothetical protein
VKDVRAPVLMLLGAVDLRRVLPMSRRSPYDRVRAVNADP